MSFSIKFIFFKTILIFFTASALLSPLLSAKTVQFIPILMDDIIVMVKIDYDTGGGTTPVTNHLKKTGQTTIYYTHDDGYYEKGVTPN